MKPLGNPREHYWLVTGMANRLGADMPAAFEAGAVSTEEWAGMVERCRGCAEPGNCRSLLDAHEGDTAPGYCRNAARLMEIAER